MKRHATHPVSGKPGAVHPEYTTELLNVLNVLARLVALEPAQADLLARICDGPTLDADALRAAGAFDEPGAASKRTAAKQGQMTCWTDPLGLTGPPPPMYRTAALAAAVLLVLALADLPYGYYTFLRLAVCAVAAFGAFRAAVNGLEGWAVALGGIALLFNPVIPVPLERETWAVIDVAAAAVLAVSAARLEGERASA